jgi:hypothetical protein
VPAHFPESNFEPSGFLEDRDQLGLAGGRGVGIGKTLQMRSCSCRDLLVGRTGVFGDPNAIGVRFGVRPGLSGEPRRDLRVADHARGERHLERQQIASHSRIQHVTRIGQQLDRRSGLLKIVRR